MIFLYTVAMPPLLVLLYHILNFFARIFVAQHFGVCQKFCLQSLVAKGCKGTEKDVCSIVEENNATETTRLLKCFCGKWQQFGGGCKNSGGK